MITVPEANHLRKKVDWDLLKFSTRNVEDVDNERLISKHLDCLFLDRSLNGSNKTVRGAWLEAIIIDYLLRVGVDPNVIKWAVDPVEGKDIDVDIQITARDAHFINIFSKTSLRERWRQPDRDSMAMKMYFRDTRNHLLMGKEDIDWTWEKCRKFCDKICKRSIGIDTVTSVYDLERLKVVMLDIRDGI